MSPEWRRGVGGVRHLPADHGSDGCGRRTLTWIAAEQLGKSGKGDASCALETIDTGKPRAVSNFVSKEWACAARLDLKE